MEVEVDVEVDVVGPGGIVEVVVVVGVVGGTEVVEVVDGAVVVEPVLLVVVEVVGGTEVVALMVVVVVNTDVVAMLDVVATDVVGGWVDVPTSIVKPSGFVGQLWMTLPGVQLRLDTDSNPVYSCSMSATAQEALGKTVSHCLNGKFVVRMIDFCS